MRILIISQFFPPEMGAPAARFFDFARHWIDAGHQVSVVTPFPSWPTGIIPHEYRKRLYQRERIGNIDVYRGYVYASPRVNFLTKILGYISFMISAALIVLCARIQCDVVISTSPPLLPGLPGILASCLKRVPLVFDVRDIWPESAAQIGLVKSRTLIRFLERIEMYIYRRSDLISVVTHGKINRLSDRGVPEEKIVLIRNGVDLHLFDRESSKPLPADLAEIAKRHACLTYAGILGVGQGLDTLIDSALNLREETPEVYEQVAFVLIGDGPVGDHLRTRKEELHLDHVFFVGVRPREEVFAVLRRSYATIVSLCPRPDTHTVPSKLYEAMAPERPVILCAEGESAEIVQQSKGGTVCEPGNACALSQAIRDYLQNAALADTHGQAARKYCEDRFDRHDISKRFLDILVHLAQSRPRERKTKR